MSRPTWLHRHTNAPVAPPKERSPAMVNATGRALAALDARIAAHGADGLPAWLSTHFGGLAFTDRACAMQRVMRHNFGREVLAACREALP
jgi:hypothetical protein